LPVLVELVDEHGDVLVGPEHLPWRAFLLRLTAVGLDQPGRYAAVLFRPVHNIRV